MNRRTRTMVVIGLAVMLAGLASFGVYFAIQRMPVREVQIAQRHQVVANMTIPVGVLVAKEQVRLAAWPADAPVAGGFASIDEVVGRGVTAAFVANEPLTDSKLASREAGGGLPPMIPEGMRAMSVKVNDIIGVAGYTTPGTRVDVVVTTVTDKDDKEAISRIVLSNIQVLAAGTKYEQDLERKEPIKTQVVTLLVTPSDSERLALAQQEGDLMLALRNPMDVVPTQTTGVRLPGLFGGPINPPARPVVRGQPRVVAVAAPPPKTNTVEMIRGAERKQEVIK